MKRILLVLAIAAAVVPGCNNSSSDGAFPSAAGIPFFIPGPAGTNTFIARGGTGTTAAGGNGGFLSFSCAAAADAHVLRTGSIDFSFVMPTTIPSLGINPLVISADTTLTVGSGLTAGVTTVLGQ